jgi:K+-transporting ATPase ATPase C chain
MKTYWLTAMRILAVGIVLLGLVYPAVVFIAGRVFFPFQADGSLIRKEGRVIGSTLIAQGFSLPRYFQPRPSAAAFDPRSSGGSNLAPTCSRLFDIYRERIAALSAENPEAGRKIPLELVAMSGSGLDPHISLGAGLWQVPRVAGARNLSRQQVEEMVRRNAQPPEFGFIGEWRVNVLRLNRDLDRFQTGREGK